MGIHDGKVISIIGQDIWTQILSDVTNGTLNSQHMCDISRLLSPSVGGSHSRRVENGKKLCDAAEMREILSDFYNVEMCEMDTHAAVKKLIGIFRDETVRLLPLAKTSSDWSKNGSC